MTKPVPRKLVCLETYWGDHRQRVFHRATVQPFFEGLATQLEPPLRIAHRFVESTEHLAAYTQRPDGIFWRDPESFDAPVYYLSFHGSPGTVHTALETLGPDALCSAFADWGESYDNLVYFGACSVFAGRAGRRFARRFLCRCAAVAQPCGDSRLGAQGLRARAAARLHALHLISANSTEDSMVLTVFRNRLRPDAKDYPDMATRMSELARSMPGYISHKGFVAEDGERVTLVEFESEEAQRAWRAHPEHVTAQKMGRQLFYAEFRLQICSVLRETVFPPRAK